ncbi:MAG: hemerythrin HHE cation-binding protein [Gammaproteobacteria bacterium HGW-Gammaproteobacteria-8]|nr:MAG: hemerythrin HHE cation-binding protein [Gammaproteobacteria bacterium HGW-Gammaproteobacteria-8]
MLTEVLTGEHRDCDEHFQKAEALAADGRLEPAREAWQAFEAAMTTHLALEEDSLFPELEQRTGMDGGPTDVMRMEHVQIRALVGQMGQSLASGDLDAFLDQTENLNILIQQHNMKEEQMLYPMFDQVFGAQAGELLEKACG